MNSSATNSGGWASSQMRTNICGTSLSSYSGTIIAIIPAALRAVLSLLQSTQTTQVEEVRKRAMSRRQQITFPALRV